MSRSATSLFTILAFGAVARAAGVAVSKLAPNEVLLLNSYTFEGNVLTEDDRVAHWIVLFCVEWYQPCASLRPEYEQLAGTLQRQLDSGAGLRAQVRFAEVDCAVDKVLCNAQAVETYPTLVHYDESRAATSTFVHGEDPEQAARRMRAWANKALRPVLAPSLVRRAPLPLTAEEQWRAGLGAVLLLAMLGGVAAYVAKEAELLRPRKGAAACEPLTAAAAVEASSSSRAAVSTAAAPGVRAALPGAAAAPGVPAAPPLAKGAVCVPAEWGAGRREILV